ncbi:MAG: YitT family protein [Anaerolineaceae bacterium]|nr:YitT family protein [Anaerolineaceae bacterium]MDI9530855.1 YitT family protein [Chloroflexota bacterium]
MKIKEFIKQIDFSWRSISDYLLIILGGFVQALALRTFLIPSQLVGGGISGVAQLLHYLWRTPVGMITLLANIPLFVIGWRYLGGPRFALRTILSVVSFTVFTDILIELTGQAPITDDILLNSLYGGIILGIGLGLVYLGRGTSGGTDILTRILNQRLGMSISLAYMITDSFAVLLAGFFFSWDKSLYGLIMIYLSGVAADMVSQGTNVIREAMIITDETEKVVTAITQGLGRGTTIINAKGGYTNKNRPIVFCVVTAGEVMRLKAIVHEADPDAFMVVGHANEALGEGFKPLTE